MDNKIDIKSSTIDKGLEIAKDFVDKLIMPSIEETGLLVKDQITMWRFKNQVKMLNLANQYCIKHNIQPKKISLKVLFPLLEYSSLEEEDQMQDKWSVLLSNLIDSEQNIENHVFPYILSQLSKDEFFPLEKVYNNRISRFLEQKIELENYIQDKQTKNKELKDELEAVSKLYDGEKGWSDKKWHLYEKRIDLEGKIKALDSLEYKIRFAMNRPEVVPEDLFRDFEISNLIRLGLIKEVKEFYAESQTLEIPNDRDYQRSHINVDLEIDVDSTTEYILTELGELFYKACQEKNNA